GRVGVGGCAGAGGGSGRRAGASRAGARCELGAGAEGAARGVAGVAGTQRDAAVAAARGVYAASAASRSGEWVGARAVRSKRVERDDASEKDGRNFWGAFSRRPEGLLLLTDVKDVHNGHGKSNSKTRRLHVSGGCANPKGVCRTYGASESVWVLFRASGASVARRARR